MIYISEYKDFTVFRLLITVFRMPIMSKLHNMSMQIYNYMLNTEKSC